jgi:hypothetical protein
MNPDGSGSTTLATGCCPVRSPDGKKIAYVAGGIWTMDADGSNKTQIGGSSMVSPTGRP